MSECTCDLHEITTPAQKARGEVEYIRGLPNGCPIHETPLGRAQRIEHERAANEADARRAQAERDARAK